MQIEPYYSGTTGVRQGLLTAILELGAWVGVLINGWLADAVGRRLTVVIACAVFTVGVIIQACTVSKDYVLAGRFVTGIGVGAFSMLVPLYNAELAPPGMSHESNIIAANFDRGSRCSCCSSTTCNHIWYHGKPSRRMT